MYQPRYQARPTYAKFHRNGAHLVTVAPQLPGAGVLRQTVSGAAKGFTTPVVAVTLTDRIVYFVQSEKFQDRYYTMFRWPGSGNWYLSDEDTGRTGYAAFIAGYVARVEAFIAAQDAA